jgi:hypothetical protein
MKPVLAKFVLSSSAHAELKDISVFRITISLSGFRARQNRERVCGVTIVYAVLCFGFLPSRYSMPNSAISDPMAAIPITRSTATVYRPWLGE